MTRQSHNLIVSVEKSLRQLFINCLGYEPDTVKCRFLESMDLVIEIERQDSATEKFLLIQGERTLAQQIGLTINRILQAQACTMLTEQFSLSVAEVSILQPMSSSRFGMLVLIESEKVELQRANKS